MADKMIGELPLAPQVMDNSLLAVEQGGIAMRMTGAQFKEFAKAGVKAYVERAENAAVKAEGHERGAEAAATRAEAAAKAAEQDEANLAAAVSDARNSASKAEASENAAAQSAANAQKDREHVDQVKQDIDDTATQVHKDAVDAEAAKLAAEAAQKIAEDARDVAVDASILATDKADDAADSAEQAKQYSGKPPMIKHGTWWIWNAAAQEYQDTGETANGNVLFATFAIDVVTGLLIMTTPDEYHGPEFHLVDGMLEVSISA